MSDPMPHTVAGAEPERDRVERRLEKLELESISYFITNRAPGTGLVLDRVTNGPQSDPGRFKGMASIAATGYGLSALILASEKNLIPKDKAAELVLENLRFIETHTPREQRGWLAHFMHADTGKTFGFSEISSIDTVLYYMNALAAAEYFKSDVEKQVNSMLANLDFDFMLTRGGAFPQKLQFSHGFFNENSTIQFIPWEWDHVSEGILIPFLALGSGQGKIDPKVWSEGFNRKKDWEIEGEKTFAPLPLFTYYYPLGFLNLKGRVDGVGENFWAEAEKAARMQISFCKADGYPEGLFGISACDGPLGYMAFYPGHNYGSKTIAPTAALACLPLAEGPVLACLEKLEKLGLCDREYGLAGAFDCGSAWTATDAVGIDVGSTLLMVDAYRRGTIHALMEKSPVVQRAMQRCGFKKLKE
jgi:hypothetical protein